MHHCCTTYRTAWHAIPFRHTTALAWCSRAVWASTVYLPLCISVSGVHAYCHDLSWWLPRSCLLNLVKILWRSPPMDESKISFGSKLFRDPSICLAINYANLCEWKRMCARPGTTQVGNACHTNYAICCAIDGTHLSVCVAFMPIKPPLHHQYVHKSPVCVWA